jgi:hypothetical protein
MSARGLFSRLMLVVVVVLVVALVPSSAAFAKLGFAQLSSLAPPEGFGQPYGVAVDNSTGLSSGNKGDVYVSDRNNSVIDEFSASGALLAQASVPGVTLGELSVEEAGPFEGYVFVAGESNGVVYRFAPGLASSVEVVTGLLSPSDVTVDAAGGLFVSEASALEVLEFDAAGQPVDASGVVVKAGENVVATDGGLTELLGVAVDPSGSSLYLSGLNTGSGSFAEVLKFTLSAGSYVAGGEPFARSATGSGGVTVGPSGDVYTEQFVLETGGSGGEWVNVFAYEPSGGLLGEGGFDRNSPYSFDLRGIAVSSESGDVFVANSQAGDVAVLEPGQKPEKPVTEAPSGLVGFSATFNGTLNGAQNSYFFRYNSYGEENRCHYSEFYTQGTTPVAATGVQAVHVELEELARATKYTYCLIATNKYGYETGAPVTFETGQYVQPRISGEAVSLVATRSATITAQINPEGIPATYYVEYGRTKSYEAKTERFGVPASEGPVSVTTQLTGLTPGTTYHFRVVAADSVGAHAGPDVEFATYPSVLSGLPDGRVDEMVTPAYNPYDMDVYEVTSGLLSTTVPFESSVDGNTVVYAGLPSAEGTGSSGTGGEEGVGAGEQYRATRYPQGGWDQVNVTPVGGATFEKYAGFSPGLSKGVIPSIHTPPFGTIEGLTNGEGEGEYNEIYETSFNNVFRPLFSMVPPNRPAQNQTKRGERFEAFYAGASSDFSHLLFEANDALVEGSGEAERELAEVAKKDVEEKTKHSELYASVGGRASLVNVLPDGKLAAGAAFGDGLSQESESEVGDKNLSNAISTDGSRIFWTSQHTSPGVYVREDGVRTVPVSLGSGTYRTASVDGRYAYYTQKEELWRFDTESETREALASGKAGVRVVVGVNQTGPDGAYVYFIAEGVLAGENAAKQSPVDGEGNLYVSEPDPAHPGGHVTRFIGALSFEDERDWARLPGSRTAQVAPDGRSVVFTSTANLTGHHYPGEGSAEVYDYRTADGRVFCVSCRPQASGGFLSPSQSGVFVRRWISENGDRVFFESNAPLVEQDIDGTRDVYEWEPNGTEACVETEGCVYLLSKGREGMAFFADASASGDDVFIATRQRLVPEDQNEDTDLYDVRVNGALSVAPPQCVGTGCQGAPASAPIFATPSSVTFTGVGNFPPPQPSGSPPVKGKGLTRSQKLSRALAVCHRKRTRKQRRACERDAHKLYGGKTGKSAIKRAR